MNNLLRNIPAVSLFLISLTIFTTCTPEKNSLTVFLLEDPEGSLTLPDIAESDRFLQAAPDLNPGFTDSVFWIKPPYRSESADLLIIESAMGNLISDMRYYCNRNRSEWVLNKSGYKNSNDPHFKATHLGIFPLPGVKETCYLRIESEKPLEFSVSTATRPQADALEKKHLAVVFVWIGIWGMGALAGFFLYFSFRDRFFLFYSLYTIPLGIIYFSGYLFAYLLLDPSLLPGYSLISRGMPFLTAALYLEMLRIFFFENNRGPFLNYFFTAVSLILTAAAVLMLFTVGNEPLKHQMLISYAVLLTAALLGMIFTENGRKAMPFLTIFWGINAFKIINRSSALLGSESVRFLSVYGSPLGLFMELFLLALRLHLQHSKGSRLIRKSDSPAPLSGPEQIMKQGRTGFSAEFVTAFNELFIDKKIFLNENLTIRDAAELLHVKPYLITKYLKQEKNTDFRDFVNSLRIDEARRLLEDPDYNITRIAYESGFNSRSAFYSSFQKKTGLLPGDYRKKNQKKVS